MKHRQTQAGDCDDDIPLPLGSQEYDCPSLQVDTCICLRAPHTVAAWWLVAVQGSYSARKERLLKFANTSINLPKRVYTFMILPALLVGGFKMLSMSTFSILHLKRLNVFRQV